MKLRALLEKGIDLSDVPGSYITPSRELAIAAKPYYTLTKEVKELIRNVRWQDIQFFTENTYKYPILPDEIQNKIREANSMYNRITAELSRKFDNRVANQIKKVNFGKFATRRSKSGASVYFELQRSHRVHMPGGIDNSLRGLGLGYKLYRALIQHGKYVYSSSNASTEARRAWQSVLKQKPDPDDVHAIVSQSHICAIVKNIPDRDKIEYTRKFLNLISLDGITPQNFKMSDDLKSILPDDLSMQLDPQRREEARRQREEERRREQQRREQEQARQQQARLEEFGVTDINSHNWDIGDYIVLKQFLLSGYEPLPIRMVVAKEGNTWYALKLQDAFRYLDDRRYGLNHDNRTTNRKEEWVKLDINRADDARIPAQVRERARSSNPSDTDANQTTPQQQAAPDTPGNVTYPNSPQYRPRQIRASARPFINRSQKNVIKKIGVGNADIYQHIYLNPMQVERQARGKVTEVCVQAGAISTKFFTTVGAQIIDIREMGYNDELNVDQWLHQNGWKKYKLQSIESKTVLEAGQHILVAGSHRSLYGMLPVVDSYLLNTRQEEHAYVNMYDAMDDGRRPRKVYIKIPDVRVLELVRLNENRVPNFESFEKDLLL